MKTEVYSWRVSPTRKADLESEARREGTSVAELLEKITSDWLEQRRTSRNGEEAEQAALRQRVLATVGTIRGGDPTLASRAREVVRERIIRKNAEESRASPRPHYHAGHRRDHTWWRPDSSLQGPRGCPRTNSPQTRRGIPCLPPQSLTPAPSLPS